LGGAGKEKFVFGFTIVGRILAEGPPGSRHVLRAFSAPASEIVLHIIDTRAQADALILNAIEELQVLDVCAEQMFGSLSF
jgi:hypothetical protein